MKKRQKLLTDEQWELVEPMLPPPRRRQDNRGRPWASNRACFEGILWMLHAARVAGFARGVSVTLDLLATAAGLGGARGLVGDLAGVSGGAE